jgi:hypothetical protein
VLAVRDNPRFDSSMPDCVQNVSLGCGAPRAELYPADPPWTRIPDLPSNVAFLDIADAVCTPAFCRRDRQRAGLPRRQPPQGVVQHVDAALLGDATVAALGGP